MKIKEFGEVYFQRFQEAMSGIEVSNLSSELSFGTALEQIHDKISEVQNNNKKIMIIGNGGSAGVASHLSVDFWKNGNIRSVAFNDSSLLTCVANDFSFKDVFQVPIRQFADKGDMLICISSSGGSENIKRGAEAARELGCSVITCSGFNPENPLRKVGDLNFYVPSYSYGVVETLHQLIIHAFLDAKLHCTDKLDVFMKNNEM